jgi:hypothetical protein
MAHDDSIGGRRSAFARYTLAQRRVFAVRRNEPVLLMMLGKGPNNRIIVGGNGPSYRPAVDEGGRPRSASRPSPESDK